jgi:hypothetical protein
MVVYGRTAHLVGWVSVHCRWTSTGETEMSQTNVTSSARSGTWHLLVKLRLNQIHAMSAAPRRRKGSLVVGAAKHKINKRAATWATPVEQAASGNEAKGTL